MKVQLPLHKKMKLSIKNFFSKCVQIRIWSNLLKKSLMGNFIFCVVYCFIFFINSMIKSPIACGWSTLDVVDFLKRLTHEMLFQEESLKMVNMLFPLATSIWTGLLCSLPYIFSGALLQSLPDFHFPFKSPDPL